MESTASCLDSELELAVNCASFAANAEDAFICIYQLIVAVALDDPSGPELDAVTELVQRGAEVERILICGLQRLLGSVLSIIPVNYMCETIKDCHSSATLCLDLSTIVHCSNRGKQPVCRGDARTKLQSAAKPPPGCARDQYIPLRSPGRGGQHRSRGGENPCLRAVAESCAHQARSQYIRDMINLERNNIGPAGARALAGGLAQNRTLSVLLLCIELEVSP